MPKETVTNDSDSNKDDLYVSHAEYEKLLSSSMKQSKVQKGKPIIKICFASSNQHITRLRESQHI